MIRRAGTAVHANDWWLVPVAGAEASNDAEPHDLTAKLLESASSAGALDAELLFNAFPLSSSRKLRYSAIADGELGIVATRAVTTDHRRHDLEHVIVLRARAGRIEALFGGSSPSPDARSQICAALVERLADALAHRASTLSSGIAPSDRDVGEILSVLHEHPRLDSGVDRLAFRIGSRSSDRAMYVYLYGSDSAQIHFDLEDPAAETEQWDGAVARGSVTTIERLALVAREWLDNGGLYGASP
jgi:hypothetical protein